MKTKSWFIKRIGKTIYRNKGICKCETCIEVEKNGLVIIDKAHAEDLFDAQNELNYNYEDNNS